MEKRTRDIWVMVNDDRKSFPKPEFYDREIVTAVSALEDARRKKRKSGYGRPTSFSLLEDAQPNRSNLSLVVVILVW